MGGEADEIQTLLQSYRGYLRTLAAARIAPRLRGKLDPSDIVQQSMLQAFQAWDQCRGTSDGERLAWLRQIVIRNVLHALRDFRRQKRDIGRECSLEEAIEASSQRLEHWLIAEQSTPSGPVRQAEEILEIARALDELPSFQREAIVMFYWQGCSLAEIGEIMGRSGPAVAGLLHRGLKRLRERLAEPE
jgi:RNA polymerase sigma-70 factor (ECF subfamily)